MSASEKKKKAKPKAKKAATTRKAPPPKVSKAKKVAKAPVEEEEKPKKPAPKPKKEAPAKVSVKAEPVALGPLPEATIASRHIDSTHERPARGFSFGELASAGVPLNSARREGLSLDIRRRSVVEGNVEALRGWLKSAGKPTSETTAEPVAVTTAGKKK